MLVVCSSAVCSLPSCFIIAMMLVCSVAWAERFVGGKVALEYDGERLWTGGGRSTPVDGPVTAGPNDGGGKRAPGERANGGEAEDDEWMETPFDEWTDCGCCWCGCRVEEADLRGERGTWSGCSGDKCG
jgi:hypothetical protein